MQIAKLGMEITDVPGVEVLRVDANGTAILVMAGAAISVTYDARTLAEFIGALQVAHQELGGTTPLIQWSTLRAVPQDILEVIDKDSDQVFRRDDGDWDVSDVDYWNRTYGPFRPVA